MSFANQPSRLLISSDDLEFGQGNNFNISLPEPITGATTVDLIRAVIPNTGYSIPDYQNVAYLQATKAGTTYSIAVSLPINQWYDGIANQTTPAITYSNPLLPVLQTALATAILGASPSPMTAGDILVSYTGNQSTPTQRIRFTGGAGVQVRLRPSTEWATRFSLNTRLGFQNEGTGFASVQTGTILPNIIRSKVVYVLCNVVLNDSISTDGLRTAIAKIPVNSTYGGLTIYNPPVLNYNRLVPSNGYQNINVSLLDDQYQPYPLQTEEFCDLELVFRYSQDKDKAFNF
jgi:hypothetical protein